MRTQGRKKKCMFYGLENNQVRKKKAYLTKYICSFSLLYVPYSSDVRVYRLPYC